MQAVPDRLDHHGDLLFGHRLSVDGPADLAPQIVAIEGLRILLIVRLRERHSATLLVRTMPLAALGEDPGRQETEFRLGVTDGFVNLGIWLCTSPIHSGCPRRPESAEFFGSPSGCRGGDGLEPGNSLI